jgi:cysteinyl-tRNA synthetase
LGPSFDIHTGGEDNIFPHHEDEIAQSESASSKKFVKYWIHTRHLLVEGEKMAKSKGNFYTLEDLKNRGYSPLAFRLLVLTAHRKNKFNFTFRGLKEAERNLEKISQFLEKLNHLQKQKGSKKKRFAKNLVLKTQKEWELAMNDDCNTPAALALLFHLISRGNYLLTKNKLTPADAEDISKVLRKIDGVFGFIFRKKPKKEISREILKLVKEREKYRKEGNFEKADEIRRKIKEMGYFIEDTKEGPRIKKRAKN